MNEEIKKALEDIAKALGENKNIESVRVSILIKNDKNKG